MVEYLIQKIRIVTSSVEFRCLLRISVLCPHPAPWWILFKVKCREIISSSLLIQSLQGYKLDDLETGVRELVSGRVPTQEI